MLNLNQKVQKDYLRLYLVQRHCRCWRSCSHRSPNCNLCRNPEKTKRCKKSEQTTHILTYTAVVVLFLFYEVLKLTLNKTFKKS